VNTRSSFYLHLQSQLRSTKCRE